MNETELIWLLILSSILLWYMATFIKIEDENSIITIGQYEKDDDAYYDIENPTASPSYNIFLLNSPTLNSLYKKSPYQYVPLNI